jgi:DHA3 family tetracycline resistance protein-like MFS transporter
MKNFMVFSFLLLLAQSFFYATYQLFLVSKGLDLFQINAINIAFMVSNFVFELPTGSFADTFGRKNSVALGCLLKGISFFIYFYSDTFWQFVGAEVIGAFGLTFISGALEAWLISTLKYYGGIKAVKEKEKIYEIRERYGLVGCLAGTFIGACCGKYNLAIPWILSGSAFVAASLFAYYRFKEEYFTPQKLTLNPRPMLKNMRLGLKYSLANKAILVIIAFGSILSLSCQAFNMQWPIVFSAYGFKVGSIGLLFMVFYVATFIGSQISRRLTYFIADKKNAIVWTQSVTAVGMIISGLVNNLPILLTFFIIHEIGRGMIKPLYQAYIDHRANEDQRATINSFNGAIEKAGGGIGLLISGLIANNVSIGAAWVTSALILGISIPFFLMIKTKEQTP